MTATAAPGFADPTVAAPPVIPAADGGFRTARRCGILEVKALGQKGGRPPHALIPRYSAQNESHGLGTEGHRFPMNYIDPHIHMVSRTTDDYKRMALAGCALVSEPAFWAGFDRSGPEGFADYFRQLTQFERKRSLAHGIEHRTWLCINAKEAENVELSRAVIKMIPDFLDNADVLGIGEIGLNKNTKNEAIVFLEHIDLAARTGELVLVHTPHLEDKFQGTRMILDMIRGDGRIAPERVCIDHVEEHTIQAALDAGHWAGMTLYPITKCTPARAADMIEMYGTERIMVNSAGDWGHSDPLAVPEFIFEMRQRGHDDATIRKIVFDNPLRFFRQCNRFQYTPRDCSEAQTAAASL